jgi:hypothetical protein
MAKRAMTVAVNFWVEFDVEEEGEPEAILKMAPQIHELQEKLAKLGYISQIEKVRVRRPRTAEKAQVRESEKRKNGGAGH